MSIDTAPLTDVGNDDQHDDDTPAPGRRPAKLVLGSSYVEVHRDHTASELAEVLERAERYGYLPILPEESEAEELPDGHLRIHLVPATLDYMPEPYVILRHDPSQSEVIRLSWDETVGAHVVTFGSYPHGEGALAGVLYGLAQGALPAEAE